MAVLVARPWSVLIRHFVSILEGGRQYTEAATVVHDFLHFESATWTQHNLLLRKHGKMTKGGVARALPVIDPELLACAVSSQASHPGVSTIRDCLETYGPMAFVPSRYLGFEDGQSKFPW